MTRDELQKLAADRLARNGRLICQWATSVGKSGVVMNFLRAHREATCLILVPEQNNIQNWENEFSKFGVPMELVRVACYASFHKYADTTWDLIVFDEMPHLDTQKRLAICQTVKGRHILALGAVIDQDERDSLESVYGSFEKSVVSLEKAIEWNILPPPTVNIIHMKLDDTEKKYWLKGRKLTEKQMYDALEAEVKKSVDAFNNVASQSNKRWMFASGNQRKRFLGDIKSEAVWKLCAKLTNLGKRHLCFCSSIKQAEALGGERAFTSKTPASYDLLNRFNNHEIDSLYVVGKLIEGQNLKDIECGVIVQLGGTSRITVQEIGRIMRAENPVIYVPVFDGTKDDSFLYTLTSNIPDEYIKHYKL